MSVKRQFNFLSQERIDLPHLRSLESSIVNDFDLLSGNMLAGKVPLVLKGLTISSNGAISQPAENLQLNVAGSLIMHYGASEAGSIFSVEDNAAPEILTGTNPKVQGGFVAGVTNYIGLDLIRSADTSTADLAQFLDVGTNEEVPEVVPLARTLQYKIIISSQNFAVSSNILPIAKVVLDGAANVTSITDARRMMFRLGSGGDNANALSSYAWVNRRENPITLTTGVTSPFIGEDKYFTNLKSWMDAIMTSIWEVKGGERWYSAAHPYNVKIAYGHNNTLNDNFEFSGGTLKWENLRLIFENAETGGVYHNEIVDNNIVGIPVVFPNDNGQCLYVDLVRESNAAGLTLQRGNLWEINASSIPGRRYVIAWFANDEFYTRDRPYEVGRTFALATAISYGMVNLSRTSYPVGGLNDAKVISTGGGDIAALAGSGDYGLKATGDAAEGGLFYGGGGSRAIFAFGGPDSGAMGGSGIEAFGGFGGNPTGAAGTGGFGGIFTGGTGTGAGLTGVGGTGIKAEGHAGGINDGNGGYGGIFLGGATTGGGASDAAGHGLEATGGTGSGATSNGGLGGMFFGGGGSVGAATTSYTNAGIAAFGSGITDNKAIYALAGNANATVAIYGEGSDGVTSAGGVFLGKGVAYGILSGGGSLGGSGIWGIGGGNGTGVVGDGGVGGRGGEFSGDTNVGVFATATGAFPAIRGETATATGSGSAILGHTDVIVGNSAAFYGENTAAGKALYLTGGLANGNMASIISSAGAGANSALFVQANQAKRGIGSELTVTAPIAGYGTAVHGLGITPAGLGYEDIYGVYGSINNSGAGGFFENTTGGATGGPAIKVGAGSIQLKSNTAAYGAYNNVLVADNTPKSWGVMATGTLGVLVGPTLNGYNFNSATTGAASVSVLFVSPMNSIHYSVVLTVDYDPVAFPTLYFTAHTTGAKSVNGFTFVIFSHNIVTGAGAFVNPSTDIVTVNYQVFATQTL